MPYSATRACIRVRPTALGDPKTPCQAAVHAITPHRTKVQRLMHYLTTGSRPQAGAKAMGKQRHRGADMNTAHGRQLLAVPARTNAHARTCILSSTKKVCATGAGSASPVVSTSTASILLRRFSSLLRILIRSPRTVQQMQLWDTYRRQKHSGRGGVGACAHDRRVYVRRVLG